MVISVSCRVDVEGGRKAPIAVLAKAFVVTFELRALRIRVRAASCAFDLLLLNATRTCNRSLCGARDVLVAGCLRRQSLMRPYRQQVGRLTSYAMTGLLALVVTKKLRFAAWL